MKTSLRNSVLAVAATFCVGVAGSAWAGDLVMDGRVVRIASTGDNSNVFSIKVSGGSLNLCGSDWITFPASAADADSHKRAYSAALLALTTGMPIRVHNYQSNNCETASYIELGAS